MQINNNPMNPVPLWPSKNDWYCKKATNHGALAMVTYPTGLFPAMQLTLKSDNLPTDVRRVSVHYGEPLVETDTYTGTLNVTNGIVLTYQLKEIDIFPTEDENTFVVTYKYNDQLHPQTFQMFDENGNSEISGTALASSITLYNSDRSFMIVFANGIDMVVKTDLVMHLYKCDDTSASSEITVNCPISAVPQKFRTSTRYATIVVEGQVLNGVFDEGSYYMTVMDADNVTWYSEPFMWLNNTSRYTHIIYRRSEPVVTTDNYIPFSTGGEVITMDMYLPGRVLMPPFTFNDEVEEIDGRKFTRKQVSYRDDKCVFMCSAYFAEAIRLLWHCDIRTIDGIRVDYMVRPEIDWNTDNHLCHVTVEFQGDTVMQTNGTSAAYGDSSDSDHQAYDASFDASFR